MSFLDDTGVGRLVANIKQRADIDYQAKLVSGTNIKTVGGTTLLGSGNIAFPSHSQCFWGTSSTSAGVSRKAVSCSRYSYVEGAIIGVYFENANTVTSGLELTITNGSAKSVYIGETTTGTNNSLLWSAKTTVFFMATAAGYRFITAVSDYNVAPARGAATWYGECTTAATENSKKCDIPNFVKAKGSLISIKFANANTANTLTLQINGTSWDYIQPSNNLRWDAGDTLTFMYDGTYYRYLATSRATYDYNVTTDISSYITVASGYTGRIVQAYERNGFITLRLLLNRGGTTNFTQGRTSGAFTINSAYAPYDQIIHPIGASTAVNGYINRWANLLITTTGATIIDSYAYADIKEMEITVTYMKK